jgi:beta-galactosidase
MKRTLGTCYYPEHWPESQWSEDAALMKASGLTWVRIGEFSWSKVEPTQGKLAWRWLDDAIDVLGKAGLKVVLGTPTATPPIWMVHKWPDMLAVDEMGNPRKFGSRRHYCFSHEGYRTESERIARLFGERYGSHPYVAAWQIDNEYSCHDTTVSYSVAARQGFQRWLEQKYQKISTLNQAWGNVFWSMEYTAFSDIDLPNLTVTEANPSHRLDFSRYSSDQVVGYNRVQVDVLRQFTQAPLIHNYMGRITDFDHYKVGADLDIASWDSYPLGFLEDRSEEGDAWKERFSKQGDPDFQAFHHDLYRTVGKGRWWIMEQQPGPVNWAPFNPAPLPGMVRLWSWEAFAHGAEAVCYFRWRQAPFAQEQMHTGLLKPNSQPARGLHEASQVSAELESLPEVGTFASKIALVFDYESDWAWRIQPQGQSFSYFSIVLDFYRGLRRLGQSVDIISPDTADLDSYQVVLIPGLMTLSDTLQQQLATFKGTILAGPRTASKDTHFATSSLGAQYAGFAASLEFVQSLRPNSLITLPAGGAFHKWHETYSHDTAGVVETDSMGVPALICQDNIWYLAGWPDAVAMDRLLTMALDNEGLSHQNMPVGLRVRDTETHQFLFNYDKDPVTFDGQEIEPAGVVWKRK